MPRIKTIGFNGESCLNKIGKYNIPLEMLTLRSPMNRFPLRMSTLSMSILH